MTEVTATAADGVDLRVRLRSAAEPAAVWLLGALVVTLTAGSTGGFLATTQGWAAVLTLWLAGVLALVRDRLALSATAWVLLGGLAAFTGWVALSALWSPTVTSTMHEVQRNLAYLGIVAAGLVATRRRTAPHLLGGVLAAITLISLYALATRLLPDRLGDFDSTLFRYRLAAPITYWNGLGIFVVIGIFLALGFAARAQTLLGRALPAAAIPSLVATMYFTFSRGAWAALAIGLAVAVVVERRRLQLLAVAAVLAPWAVVAVASAHDRSGLRTLGSTLQQAVDDGHSLVLPLVALSVASGATAAAAALVERRVAIPRVVRTGFAVVCVAALGLGLAATWAREGAPWQLADRAWAQFNAGTKESTTDASARLFQLSANGRLDLWRTSWDGFRARPLLGTGAGSFWQEWARSPHRSFSSQEGHSLPMEVLGEMGLPGLALVLLALAMPVVAGVRARAHALGPPALAAYAAWLAHAAVDWDWELVGLGAAALLVAAALVRLDEHRARDRRWEGPLLASACLAASVVAGVGLLGSEAIRSATKAMARGDDVAALDDLDRAQRWAPWSSQPDELRANLWLNAGKRARAAAAYRAALDKDAESWLLWSAYAGVAVGDERVRALERAAALNPPP